MAGRQLGVPTLAASQGRTQAAQAEGLLVTLFGNDFGFVGAAFIEEVRSVATPGTRQRGGTGQYRNQHLDYRVAGGVWADAGRLWAVPMPPLAVMRAAHTHRTHRAATVSDGADRAGAHDVASSAMIDQVALRPSDAITRISGWADAAARNELME